MKNQYFGDEIDYLKYGILRVLCQQEAPPPVHCAWMLTADDARSDGQRTGYLDAPGRWRAYDPALFDALQRLVAAGQRHVRHVGTDGIVPTAQLHEALVDDDSGARAAWFAGLHGALRAGDLVFFDPDNGLEVTSCKPGRRGSCKYLFLDEVAEIHAAGCTQLIFQHFPRVARAPYIARRAAQLAEVCGGVAPLVLRTSRVAWFLVVHPEAHTEQVAATLRQLPQRVAAQWSPAIEAV